MVKAWLYFIPEPVVEVARVVTFRMGRVMRDPWDTCISRKLYWENQKILQDVGNL